MKTTWNIKKNTKNLSQICCSLKETKNLKKLESKLGSLLKQKKLNQTKKQTLYVSLELSMPEKN